MTNKKFSERIKAVECDHTIQIDYASDELKNSIWNFIYVLFDNQEDGWRKLARLSSDLFFKLPIDEIPNSDIECRRWVKEHYYNFEWHQMYDFIEFIYKEGQSISDLIKYHQQEFIDHANSIFERELSGYRFISTELVPISNSSEASEISSAVSTASLSGLFGASEHLKASLRLISIKPNPDYRNSIKEAISSIESVVKQLSKSESEGLHGALEQLNSITPIHGALRSGFEKLYGYSSDESGIRHAILEQKEISYEEAKYMLVACSAFVNYLIVKGDKAGLLES